MTQQRWKALAGPSRPAHRVDLRVANAAGKELDQNLVGRRVRQLDLIHDQRLIRFHQDCRPTFGAHVLPPRSGQDSENYT
jgi:hypothetical protein